MVRIMSTAEELPTDQASTTSESRHNYGLYQDPVDYAYLEEHLDEVGPQPYVLRNHGGGSTTVRGPSSSDLRNSAAIWMRN